MAAPTEKAKRYWSESARNAIARVRELLGKDIWELEYLGHKTIRARAYWLLRIITLTFQGLRRNKIPVQAAALTFYSLIGIGPLIAFGIMISGFALEKGDESIVTEGIYKAIAFAAPQVTLQVEADETGKTELAPQMKELINNFTEAAKSGTVGVVGFFTLFVIGIQVLSSIENSFNTLWGVERGRKLGERIVVYWTFFSLGAVLGTASLTLQLLNTASALMEKLPFGGEFFNVVLLFSPLLSFLMVTLLLAVFFRFIPNTQVDWKPAFTGAALVVLLLHIYNLLSFLYVRRVVDTNSLYGSVGIIIVLMLGLFVFWLLILLGGQVTYAVQNADYLTNENAWQKTSERTREIVSLGVLLLVAKRFKESAPPIRASELHQKLRVPSHILNSSINRLCELGYLCIVEGNTSEEERDRAYHPGRPLESMTLGSFKEAFDCFGNNEGADLVAKIHPAIRTYQSDIVSLKDSEVAKHRIGDLV